MNVLEKEIDKMLSNKKYVITWVGEVVEIKYEDKYKHLYEKGVIYDTRKEAEKVVKEREILHRMHKWADEANEGWEPDFDVELSKLPYFKNDRLRKKFIIEFRDELLWLWNTK